MGQYIIRRLLWAFVMLFLVIAVVFVIFFVLPGGAGHASHGSKYPALAYMIAGKHPLPATVAAVVHRLSLDQPLYIQFGKYVGNALHGNFGYSYQTHEAVTHAILRRLPPTIGLAVGASIIWLIMGCAIGVVSALKRRSFVDRALRCSLRWQVFRCLPSGWV